MQKYSLKFKIICTYNYTYNHKSDYKLKFNNDCLWIQLLFVLGTQYY